MEKISRSVATGVSQNFMDIVIHFECSGNIGKYLKAYKDSAGIPTIGIGTIRYPNGKKVKMGDTCTEEEAYSYFRHDLDETIRKVSGYVGHSLSQGMFDALVDFAYNLGTNALLNSTLLKKIIQSPNDYKIIRAEFLKWNKVRNPKTKQLEVSSGLTRRRKCEAYLYEHGTNASGFNL